MYYSKIRPSSSNMTQFILLLGKNKIMTYAGNFYALSIIDK